MYITLVLFSSVQFSQEFPLDPDGNNIFMILKSLILMHARPTSYRTLEMIERDNLGWIIENPSFRRLGCNGFFTK